MADNFVTQEQCSTVSQKIHEVLVQLSEQQSATNATLKALRHTLEDIDKMLSTHEVRLRALEWRQALYIGAAGVLVGLPTAAWALFKILGLKIVAS